MSDEQPEFLDIIAGMKIPTEQAIERLRAFSESDAPVELSELIEEVRHITLILSHISESFETLVKLVAITNQGGVRDANTDENFPDRA